MKRFVACLLILALLLAGCTGETPVAAYETPAAAEAPAAQTETPTAAAETPAASEETAAPEPGVVKDGEYSQPFFGLGISVEGWELTDRDEIGRSLFGIPDYASYSMEELLSNHTPYVEVMMTRGDFTVQLMLEQPPLTAGDGSVANTPAEYMDAMSRSIPADYAEMGVPIAAAVRFQKELCGLDFEGYSIFVSYNGVKLYQTMLCTEKDGVFFVIYVTCVGADETNEILDSFYPLD